jgi:hypothetical protein
MYKIIGADQREYGPISAEQLRQWIAEGRANAATLVQQEGQTGWRPLSTFPEFGVAPQVNLSTPPMQAPGTNGFAITGLICSIFSLTCFWCWCLPVALAGIVFSVIGLSQINNQPLQRGREIAITGLVLSIIGLILWLGCIAVVFFERDTIIQRYSM